MATPSMSDSNFDFEKEVTREHDPAFETIHTAGTHPLGRSQSTKSTHPLEQLESHRSYTGIRWWLLCFALYISAFLYGLDNTIIADIQAPIIETFEGSTAKLSW
jgi:hypothetical protein